jgi:hypothetical protein
MPELDALDRGYSPAGGTSQQTMPRNRKLTKVIAGRTVEAATAEPRSVVLLFDDDSRMKIKTTAPVAVPPGGEVKSVQEDETELKIEFEDDSTRRSAWGIRARPSRSGTGITRWNTWVKARPMIANRV